MRLGGNWCQYRKLHTSPQCAELAASLPVPVVIIKPPHPRENAAATQALIQASEPVPVKKMKGKINCVPVPVKLEEKAFGKFR